LKASTVQSASRKRKMAYYANIAVRSISRPVGEEDEGDVYFPTVHVKAQHIINPGPSPPPIFLLSSSPWSHPSIYRRYEPPPRVQMKTPKRRQRKSRSERGAP
jgi:hypothetical protein